MPSGSPDWVRDGLAQFRAELVLFVRTLWAFLRRPRRFTREWLAGDMHALNPFGYMLTSVGVVGAVQVLASALGAKADEDGGLWKQVARAVVPVLYYLALGLATHVVLWLVGSRRARPRDTAAVALYASGPAYLNYAVILLVFTVLRKYATSAGDPGRPGVAVPGVVAILGLGWLLAFAIPFIGALREIHGVARAPWARPIFAFVTVFVLSGFFFGGLRPPGSYRLHPTIWPPAAKNQHHWVVFFGD